jgi:hypothetical protein
MRIPREPKASNNVLSTVGSTLGGLAFGPAGAIVGKAAGSLISHIMGMGDYTVERNELLNGAPPSFSKDGSGICVTHREFLADISGSINFSLASYSINPGLVTTFPWLSQLAANFEEYDMQGLIFEFRPTSGTALSSTSAAMGTVIFATNYDVADVNFATKQQMESYEFSTSTVPFNKMIHPVECKPGENVLSTQYIRTGAVVSQDLRFYDQGNFQVATVGQQSAYVLGELWVSYKCRLLKPRLQLPGDITEAYAHIRSSLALTASVAYPLGTGGGVVSSLSTIAATPTTAGFYIPSIGTYLITLLASTGSTLTGNWTTTNGSGILQLYDYNNNTSSFASTYTSVTALALITVYVSTVGYTATNLITLTAPAGYTSGNTDVMIVQLPTSTLHT